jgi:hypothetical protein
MRNYQILTKLTKKEHTQILNKAKEIGLTKSTFIRYAALKAIKLKIIN